MMTQNGSLIIGHGLAGMAMAYRHLMSSRPFKVMDAPSIGSASEVSSGIINPITGRRYAKSWKIDELLPAAKTFYRSVSQILGVDILCPTQLIRHLSGPKEENDWQARLQSDAYDAYMTDDFSPYGNVNLTIDKTQAHIQGALTLNIRKCLSASRRFLLEQGVLISEQMDYHLIDVSTDTVQYDGVKYDRVIFCEGWRVLDNPYFKHFDFDPAKGECLIIHAPALKLEPTIKDRIFILPIEDDQYWVGASYDWQPADDLPTDSKKAWLISHLDKMISCDYDIVDHRAGVRPSTKHRKPILGRHPDFPSLYLLNGLGTKGVSLAPYCSVMLMDHIFSGEPIEPELDIANR